jgi:hypothetical protein
MKILLRILVAIFALGLSVSAAYFSVLGLTKMFAGAVLGTAIVCSFIEGSKLIIASVLHQFSKKLNWLMKGVLVLFLFLSMAITSMGVYGYLTNAFQGTANQLELVEGQTKVIEMKRGRFQESLDSYTLEKTQLTQSITELSKGLSNNVIQYKDKETGQLITTTSSSTRRVLESQLNDSKTQRDKISLKQEALTDSITKLDMQVLNLNNNEELASEIGPLKFITGLTGLDMDVIVNFLTLILVFIIDPLAIVLVVVFNKIGENDKVVGSVPDGMEFNEPYQLAVEKRTEFELNNPGVEPIPIIDEVDLSTIELSEKDINTIQQSIKENKEPNDALQRAKDKYVKWTSKKVPVEEIPQKEVTPEKDFYGETTKKKRPKRFG